MRFSKKLEISHISIEILNFKRFLGIWKSWIFFFSFFFSNLNSSKNVSSTCISAFHIDIFFESFAHQRTKSISQDYLRFLLMSQRGHWFFQGVVEISVDQGKWETILLIFLHPLKQFHFQFQFHLENRMLFSARYKNMFGQLQFI